MNPDNRPGGGRMSAPANWLPSAAALLVERPELEGVGLADVVEAVCAA